MKERTTWENIRVERIKRKKERKNYMGKDTSRKKERKNERKKECKKEQHKKICE